MDAPPSERGCFPRPVDESPRTPSSPDGKVWSLKAKDLQSMLRDNPDFAMSVISSLAADLRGKTKARRETVLSLTGV